jgi:hypothetical protein
VRFLQLCLLLLLLVAVLLAAHRQALCDSV